MHLSPSDPILIYQMGKVGSSAVYKSVKALELPNALYHVHFLDPDNTQAAIDYYQSRSKAVLPGHLKESLHLQSYIRAHRSDHRWKIITLVRDPISRALSDFFQNQSAILNHPVLHEGSDAHDQVLETLLERFRQFNEAEDYACTWFDKELKRVFDFDIFAHHFPKARGYQIYSHTNVDILCLKLERLNDVFAQAFKQFTGVTINRLDPANRASQKPYKKAYNRICHALTLPNPLLERIYNTRFARQFYTAEERSQSRRRWAIGPTDRASAMSRTASADRGRDILIIHPEGNIGNNPNLSAIVETLCDEGHRVDLHSLRRPDIPQDYRYQRLNFTCHETPRPSLTDGHVFLSGKAFTNKEDRERYLRKHVPPFDLVIGVDRGIIEADEIARLNRKPCGLISYEIFFAEETGLEFKGPEIQACANLEFAICQDRVRSIHLCAQNRIPVEKVVLIPVAG